MLLHRLNTKLNLSTALDSKSHQPERWGHYYCVFNAPPVHQVVLNFVLLNTRWVTGLCKVSYHPSCIINWLVLNQPNTPDNLCTLQRAIHSWYDTTAKAFKRPIHYFTQNVFSSFLEMEVKRGGPNVSHAACIKKNQFRLSHPCLASPVVYFFSFREVLGKGKWWQFS